MGERKREGGRRGGRMNESSLVLVVLAKANVGGALIHDYCV